MTDADIQDFVTKFAAAWAARDGEAFLALWHPDGVLHSPLYDRPVAGKELGRLTEMEHLFLARTIVGAEVLISLPKLKTHHWAGATLSLKNLFEPRRGRSTSKQSRPAIGPRSPRRRGRMSLPFASAT